MTVSIHPASSPGLDHGNARNHSTRGTATQSVPKSPVSASSCSSTLWAWLAIAELEQIPRKFTESCPEKRVPCKHGPGFLEQIDPYLHAKLGLIRSDRLHPALACSDGLRAGSGEPGGMNNDGVQACEKNQ